MGFAHWGLSEGLVLFFSVLGKGRAVSSYVCAGWWGIWNLSWWSPSFVVVVERLNLIGLILFAFALFPPSFTSWLAGWLAGRARRRIIP